MADDDTTDEAEIDEELDDDEGPADPDLDADDLDDDDVVDDDDDDDAADDDDDEAADEAPRTKRKKRADDEDDEDEELVADDDVEEDLDKILKDRLVAAEDADEDDDEDEPEVRGEGGERLQPKQQDEQLCSACFLLVKSTAPNCPVGDDDCPIFS